MLAVLVKALTLVAIIGIGLLAKRAGWLSAAHFPIFSRLVLWVTLPAALLTAFNQYTFHPALLLLTVLAFAVNTGQQLIGYLLARGRGRPERAFAVLHSGSYNIGAFATPYVAGMIGPQAMLYTTMFDLGVAFGSAGLGYGWAATLVQPAEPGRLRRILLALRNPVLVTYAVLLILMLVGARLPDPVIVFTSTIGAANPFLAMLMIGVGLELRLPRRKLRLALRFLAVRYLIAILVAVATWFWLPLAADVRSIVCALWFAPLASMIPGFAERLGLDVEASTFMTSVSMAVGIVVIPLVLLLG
ncbi:MAG: AEC family transporter [Propionicimonas sp.]|uniref:AEC family transporter n=1 Tax=Propionicimonas sp. TaxID=1955623 RepID=UPI002B20C9D0|nr:AEC family transporter [Propionicimonas sp.]MEA4945885.1 AEC family transporter [Propionicimonas sp.]